MIVMMTMMTMMTLDGKSDDYDEKLFGGEKKRNPSANLLAPSGALVVIMVY